MNRKYTAALTGMAIGLTAYLPLSTNAQQNPSVTALPEPMMERSMPPADRQQAKPPAGNIGITREAKDITDMSVVNSKGEEVGSVDTVVRSTSSNDLNAVVSVGGFLGIGEKKVAVPLKDMKIKGDKLLVPLSSTEDELKARREYDAKAYSDVDGDQMVEFSAFESADGQPSE